MRLPRDPLRMTSYRIPISSSLLSKNSIYTLCGGSHHSYSNLLPHHRHHHHHLPRISLPHHPRITMSGNSDSFSAAKETFNPADTFRGQPRPEHHLHRDSEPLPGNNSTVYGQDQSKDPLWETKRDTGTSPKSALITLLLSTQCLDSLRTFVC